MMVIVIVGVLSAVALPNFVGTKSKAQAGAINGSLIGLAKECSTNAALDSPDAVTASSTAGIKFVAGTGGTNCEKGAKMSNDTAFTATEIGGSKCGSDTADGKVDTFCVITVGDNGVTEGTWGSAAAS